MGRILAIIAILAGYVVMDVLSAARLWLLLKPIERIKKARQRRRRLRELGIEEPIMEINLGTRTSTNTVVGTSLLGSIAVQIIQLLPYPELVAALTTPEAVILWGAALAWVVARFSKTPAVPGKL